MKWIYQCFGISKQAFYKRLATHKKSDQQEQVILDLVEQVRKEMPKTGGLKLYTAIKPTLVEKGIKMGRIAFINCLEDIVCSYQEPKGRTLPQTQSTIFINTPI